MKAFVSRLYLLIGCLAILLRAVAVHGQEVQHGTFGFSAEHYAVAENTSSGFAIITVTRMGGSAGVVSVDYHTVDETAVAGMDYMPVSGKLMFAAGQTTKAFVVPIIDDPLVEGSETLLLVLTNAAGGAMLPGGSESATARLAIVDNDLAPGQLSFSASSYNQDESGAFATITVTRTGGSTGVIGVEYGTMDGTATAGVDYIPAYGNLVFADGETNKMFIVQIIDNGLVEGDKTVQLVLTNATGGATFADGLDSASATLTINDDDFAAGVLSFSMSNYSEDESNGLARITVIRTGGSAGTISVQYHTEDGSAIAGMDYLGISGTITFASGQTNRTFILPILDDSLVEGDETLGLVLTNATGGATFPGGLASTSATLTILDSDGPPISRPRIQNLRRRNAQFEFSFAFEAPNRYTVEYCHSLATGNWLPLTNFTAGVSGTSAITDSMSNAPACFYRVRVER